jgi:LacI family transcriptional regulator
VPSVRIRDIAKAAGVSPTAVSFALNGRPGVSEVVRARVRRVAKKLGYEPDAEMARLMAHVATSRRRSEHSVLALINGFDRRRIWETNGSIRPFWDGVRARARELGYRVEEFWSNEPGLSPQRLRQILLARGIRGLLLTVPPPNNPESRFDFDFSGLAAAMSGYCFDRPAISYVVPDHFHNVLLALTEAYARGYRRPVLATPGLYHHHAHYLEGAFHHFLATHPDVTALPVIYSDRYEFPPVVKAIDEHRPDVVVSTGPVGWVDEFGKRIPHEFGWIDLGRLPDDDHVAGIDRRLLEQAGFVVDLVVGAIHRNEFGVPDLRKELMVPGRWVDGPTLPDRTRPAPKRAAR